MNEITAFNPTGAEIQSADSVPHSIEAEQQLLGAILTNNDVYDRIAAIIGPQHFYDPVHARIFETAAARIAKNNLASPVTLRAFLENDEGLKELGGPAYLAKLAGAAISTFAVRDYAQMIYDLAIRRALIALGHDIAGKVYRVVLRHLNDDFHRLMKLQNIRLQPNQVDCAPHEMPVAIAQPSRCSRSAQRAHLLQQLRGVLLLVDAGEVVSPVIEHGGPVAHHLTQRDIPPVGERARHLARPVAGAQLLLDSFPTLCDGGIGVLPTSRFRHQRTTSTTSEGRAGQIAQWAL